MVGGINGKEVKIGKWSEMSQTRIPEFGGGIILVKILSIRVAEVAVTLVGLLISGRKEWEKLASTNSCD